MIDKLFPEDRARFERMLVAAREAPWVVSTWNGTTRDWTVIRPEENPAADAETVLAASHDGVVFFRAPATGEFCGALHLREMDVNGTNAFLATWAAIDEGVA
jgi:hypothetical protein